MTYQATEQSVHGGKPIELYRYAGTYQTFRYTSAQTPISFQADDELVPYTYTPIAMKRTGINQVTPNDDNGDVEIELPVTTDLVSIYGFQIAPPSLELTLFRYHNSAEFIRYWNGDVENINVVKGTATIRIPSRLAAALAADFPNVYFQTPCNHTLFDARCGIDISLWSQTTTIGTVSGRNLTVGSVGALSGKLVGGDALLPSGERRMIVSQTGTSIVVNYPFSQAAPSDSIILAAGCDLAWAGDCLTRYNNTARFGGYPFTPTVNIFTSGIEPGKTLVNDPCLPDCVAFDGWDYEIVVYSIYHTYDNLDLYIWPPPGGSGGNSVGGARGDMSMFGSPAAGTAYDVRRINMVSDWASGEGVGNWNAYLAVDGGYSDTADVYVYFRHWTEPPFSRLVYSAMGILTGGAFHNRNVSFTNSIRWQDYR